jgi:hypothetical protein
VYVPQRKELQTIIYLCLNAASSKKSFDLPQVLWVVENMCHGALRTCHFVQPREQGSSAGFQRKTIHRADAEARACVLWFCCQACMPVSAKIYARCQRQRQTWKEENCMHDFEGLNRLTNGFIE